MMDAWYSWLQNIAAERIDQIERHMLAHPDEFQNFVDASRKLDEGMMNGTLTSEELGARDELWMTYVGALGIELYLAGVRDGGRVYYAFTTGELPSIQKQEEHHEQTDT